MPDLLLELFSEEIPARMQRKAADDLRRLVTDVLVEAGLTYDGAKAFVTPRRLALTVSGVTARSPDRTEERKGPKVDAPEGAIAGFLKSAGLSSIDQAEKRFDPKKGDFYVAISRKPGRAAEAVLSEALPKIVRGFPWPKAMRWGIGSAPTGTPYYGSAARGSETLRWVRPLHSIVALFGPETEEPTVLDLDIDGIVAGDTTYGHRFMAPAPIRVRRFDDYEPALQAGKVVLDADRRKDIVLHDARDAAHALSLELIEDEGLLEEVAGLNEWPVVLVGSFDEAFLAIPPEVIRATIRANQKCFVLRHPDKGEGGRDRLANRFVMVANIEASDGGAAIVAGNQRVIRARLSDARHFWETDQRDLPGHDSPAMQDAAKRLSLDLTKPLDQRIAKLASTGVVFHEKLGTQGERVERLVRLAREIAPLVGADPALAARAAALAKADLATEMVGEFPELQGLMGRYYAERQGEHPSVAAAIEDHYKPQGPSDRVPADPVAIAVALADKLDILVGFWAIDEKPTGSKDPYALRRAALGVLRILIEREIGLSLTRPMAIALAKHATGKHFRSVAELVERGRAIAALGVDDSVVDTLNRAIAGQRSKERAKKLAETGGPTALKVAESLLQFFADRLKVQLRDEGRRHDLVDAVFVERAEDELVDDFLLVVRRMDALGKFLDSEDGKNLLAGTKRAANILAIEEKKSGVAFDGAVDSARLVEPQEKALAAALDTARADAATAVEAEDFGRAMAALATLRGPVDAFFDKVLVNAPDPALRENRLRLLSGLRAATRTVADFSKVEG